MSLPQVRRQKGYRHDQRCHAILYSDDADATRATLAKVLGSRSVDAGGGWLIFALPPAELAVHPATDGGRAELYLLCDDVAATVAALRQRLLGASGRRGPPRPGRRRSRARHGPL
jgi:hypothetical protein